MGALRFSHFGELPFYGGGPLRSAFGTLLPPGGKVVAYVHADGPNGVDDRAFELSAGVVKTMQAALARCRPGKGDTVVVLPGHTEEVGADAWSNLVAGTRVVGLGQGGLKPTFSFPATDSQIAVAVDDVMIAGCQFNVDGANGVANAIDVNGADFQFIGNTVRLASGASLKAAIGMSLSAARALVAGCRFFGSPTHNVTDGILIDAAVDGIEIRDTVMIASATAANGLIRVTAAATNLLFENLTIYNTHTSSTATIAIGDVAADGLAHKVRSAMKNDGTATDQGITFGSAALVQCLDCLVVDAAKASGITSPGVET